MNVEGWTAIGGAIISALGAATAIWQARLAKGQARTAEDSASSARRQATAAERQVQLMQRQIEAEEQDRLDAGKPDFRVENGEIAEDDNNQPCVGLRLTQVKGPALSTVRVSVQGNYVANIRRLRDEWGESRTLDLGESANGAALRAWIGLEYRHAELVEITIRVEATARDSGVSWSSEQVVAAKHLPPEPMYQPRHMRRPGRDPFTP
ncbi:hypothetical protein ACFWOG_20505 [Kitasatospora sp. NPDC058406]|uniref:hypothetical protein n=1 Tax=Kitasatospora sp. NPDC058406 TaxID=3346483 RepID=UPI003652546B